MDKVSRYKSAVEKHFLSQNFNPVLQQRFKEHEAMQLMGRKFLEEKIVKKSKIKNKQERAARRVNRGVYTG